MVDAGAGRGTSRTALTLLLEDKGAVDEGLAMAISSAVAAGGGHPASDDERVFGAAGACVSAFEG